MPKTWHTALVNENDNYWMAIATILPVLGLALLLVARVQFRQAVESRAALAWLGVSTIPALLGIPIVEIVALLALANTALPDWWMLVALYVFGVSTFSLFLGPAASLVHAVVAPVGKEARIVARQTRRAVSEGRRLIKQHRKTVDGILRKEEQLLGMVSSAVWRSVEADASIVSNPDLLKNRYLSEVRQLELIAQEFDHKYRRYDATLESLATNTQKVLRGFRKAASLAAWGAFSGAVGQEGADEALAEASEGLTALGEELLEEARLRGKAVARSTLWTNQQAVARWPKRFRQQEL